MRPTKKALPLLNYSRHRLVAMTAVRTTNAQTDYNVVIPWQQPALQGVANSIYVGFNSSARWAQVQPNWDEYAITGMKVEYLPVQMFPT